MMRNFIYYNMYLIVHSSFCLYPGTTIYLILSVYLLCNVQTSMEIIREFNQWLGWEPGIFLRKFLYQPYLMILSDELPYLCCVLSQCLKSLGRILNMAENEIRTDIMFCLKFLRKTTKYSSRSMKGNKDEDANPGEWLNTTWK